MFFRLTEGQPHDEVGQVVDTLVTRVLRRIREMTERQVRVRDLGQVLTELPRFQPPRLEQGNVSNGCNMSEWPLTLNCSMVLSTLSLSNA